MSIREFVESVAWEGKDESWDTLVCDTLARNDIKSLDQIGPTSLNCTENAHIRIHEEVRLSPLPARFSILH